MTFLSDIATILAIVLVACGVNVTQLSSSKSAVSTAAVSTEAPTTAEITTEVPTAQPTSTPTQIDTQSDVSSESTTDNTESFVTEATAIQDVQTLATQMYASIISGVEFQANDLVEDNADTHLSMRWADYKAACLARDDSTKPVAFSRPGVVPTLKSIYTKSGYVIATSDCAVTMKTAAGTTQEESITFTLMYESTSSGRKIIAVDITGDADYDTLKSALPSDADIAAIDTAVDAAIAH